MKQLRFGGHETFAIREGWLYKGLKLLQENPEAYADPLVADQLGVGRNMAKAIWHWLRVTGLIEKAKVDRFPKQTPLGELIWRYDPYFVDPGTWWVLHANLCGPTSQVAVWYWFFNHFSTIRFDKAQALGQSRRFFETQAIRMPSPNTLSRDLGCLLQSYACPIPRVTDDPEEGNDCPLQDLGLLLHYRDSGLYELVRSQRQVPSPIFAYVLSQAFDTVGGGRLQIPLHQIAHAPGSPGRVFALSQEALMENLLAAEKEKLVKIQALGGERVVSLDNQSPQEWLALYYKETPKRNAA